MKHTVSHGNQLNPYDLLVQIDVLKSELIEFGLYLGLNHPITVSLSQSLDEKLTEFQKIDFMEIKKLLNDPSEALVHQ
ncbi:aspartyl-phosphate phosphatase Spo0E family protein [Metabacillus niabensis]|uniref:aspartyl-phosphate phosphatase Spo0E family protein n=1 Tax=Metabacillus niabensis TaxID=324854 RepID=UPI001CFA5DE1|nr:aspartyl-phosphate phosphatase Spo0E family protein [Metabacillus niabensis]